jgi:hypothetical protein
VDVRRVGDVFDRPDLAGAVQPTQASTAVSGSIEALAEVETISYCEVASGVVSQKADTVTVSTVFVRTSRDCPDPVPATMLISRPTCSSGVHVTSMSVSVLVVPLSAVPLATTSTTSPGGPGSPCSPWAPWAPSLPSSEQPWRPNSSSAANSRMIVRLMTRGSSRVGTGRIGSPTRPKMA